MVRRTIGIGTLLLKGNRFEFRPADATSAEAAAGDVAEVGLTFRYDEHESSGGRNSGLVLFTLTIGGIERVARMPIRDLPLVKDRQKAFLHHLVDLPAAGDVEGAWAVEATFDERPWIGGGQATAQGFRAEGKLLLRVR